MKEIVFLKIRKKGLEMQKSSTLQRANTAEFVNQLENILKTALFGK
jgi:hypothetical protein